MGGAPGRCPILSPMRELGGGRLAKADAEIAAKSTQSEARIAEIRDGALEAVTEVAKDTAKEIVAALGGKADARSVTAAVNARLKG